MLKITVPARESWSDERQEFINIPHTTLRLEHSLVSLSKWEAKWHKAFLNKKVQKTAEEVLDYIRCMCLDEDVDPNVLLAIPKSEMDRIVQYIEDPMTASWINDRKPEGASPTAGKRIMTSELIYCYMIQLNIPVEFENWHLNRLLMLIQIVNIENQPKKKMSQKDAIAHHRRVKAARRAKKGR